MNTQTLDLVAAWRAADNRYGHLDWQWRRIVRPAIYLMGVAGVVFLIAGSTALVPAMLAGAALIVGLAHAVLLMSANTAVWKTWDALGDHTGLDGEDLVRLIGDAEAGNGGAS